MYHNYISKDIKKKKLDDIFFSKDKILVKNIFDKMFQENAENLYEYYYIYKDLFNEFTVSILELENSIQSNIDISNNYVEDSNISKEIYYDVKIKKKNVIDLMKNKDNIYE